MSCSTLKRRHDFDNYFSPAPTKRRRLIQAKKRIPDDNGNLRSCLNETQSSPFANLPKPSRIQMETQLKQEVKRLRRRVMFGKENEMEGAVSAISNDNLQLHNTNGRIPCASPVANDKQGSLQSTIINLGGGAIKQGSNTQDTPLFTFKQVGMICERFMEQREEAIRQEYEKILSTQLAEQYDTFVKFTHDQIRKQFQSSSIPSYMS